MVVWLAPLQILHLAVTKGPMEVATRYLESDAKNSLEDTNATQSIKGVNPHVFSP